MPAGRLFKRWDLRRRPGIPRWAGRRGNSAFQTGVTYTHAGGKWLSIADQGTYREHERTDEWTRRSPKTLSR